MLADRVILVRRLAISLCLAAASAVAQSSSPVSIAIDWNAPAITSRTIITLQVVANPPLRPGSSIRDNAWNSLRQLHSNDTRLALWYPYPRLAVAEILPPTPTKTFWDFSAMDPLISDFFTATHGHSTVLSITTIPQWMFKGDPTPVPANPDTPVWNYEQGAALRDPGLLEISDYYERVGRWYMKGGFRDELGVLHSSGHHYSPAYWEVFNEPEYEHQLGPEEYTRVYDGSIVSTRASNSPAYRSPNLRKATRFSPIFLTTHTTRPMRASMPSPTTSMLSAKTARHPSNKPPASSHRPIASSTRF
jgi:hypothetical protein